MLLMPGEFQYHYIVVARPGAGVFSALFHIPHAFEPNGTIDIEDDYYEVYDLYTTCAVDNVLDDTPGVVQYEVRSPQ